MKLPLLFNLLAMTIIPSSLHAAPEPSGVIRHVVCFTFNDDATPEQIKQIEDAFRALPGKMPSIINFEWGRGMGTLERSRGHTHCFLLTFRNTTDRDDYLPHPEHQAFVKILRESKALQHGTVIDYAATDLSGRPLTAPEKATGTFRHLVCFQFKESSTPEQIREIEQGFFTMARAVPTVQHFEWGTNISNEGKSDGLTHCFMVTFAGKDGWEVYDKHPAHDTFRALVKPHVEKLLVIDYLAQE